MSAAPHRTNKPNPLPNMEELERLFAPDFDRGVLVRHGSGKLAGTTTYQGYRQISIGRRVYRLHRILWKMAHGSDPALIDHINGDKGDNRLCNLRNASAVENARNKRPSKSGVYGVCYNPTTKRWRARIHLAGKAVHLGNHSTFEAAVHARKEGERRHWSHPEHGSAVS